MRRIFVIILSFFLVITTVGIMFMGARLFAAKEKVESLTEAQKSLVKRLELRDAIHELRDAVIDRSQGSQITALKSKTRAIIAECWGCHHSPEITMQIGDMEKRVDKFAGEIRQDDSYYSREKVFVAVKQIVPFAESAYIKAKKLADTRTEYLTQELLMVKNAGVFTTVSGFFLFLGFSFIAMKRVSKLESDVRERERILNDWAGQWQHTFDSMQDMVFIIDKNCRILLMNRQAKDYCGESALGAPIYEAAKELMISSCKGECESGFKKEVSCDGRVFVVRSFKMLNGKEDKGCVLVVRDVTSDKDMELRLIQSEKLAALGQVTAAIAHELNNPLTSISGYSEFLLKTTTDDTVRQMVEKIYKSAARTSNIVRDLLLFSKTPVLEKTDADIKGMIHEVIDFLAEAFAASKINISEDVPSGMTFPLDAAQMERVLLNLMTNAIHAVRDSGKGDRITVKAGRDDNRLIIEVSDNGPGIPRDVVNRIFEPFFTTKRFEKGTGLGLSICYNIIKAHGGDIRVKSREGEGAAFIIELPYKEL
ncbi:MAG: hypothetical protein A2X55_00410 [Nitrospirae bacterium GWB2_47_37]|nr:MAG: hypothetical protein A2X55_00410 [Nitrospirae bacterium GWB2_47_37]HAK89929.1 hypothetical protein [Nitrospiraceae bacterium]